jgi:biopolymer transport protein ExbD
MSYVRRNFLRSPARRKAFYCCIDPFPYLGLTLVLLCLFMTMAPHTNRRTVDLFETSHSKQQKGALREDAIHISIVRDGRSFLVPRLSSRTYYPAKLTMRSLTAPKKDLSYGGRARPVSRRESDLFRNPTHPRRTCLLHHRLNRMGRAKKSLPAL